MTAFRTVLLPTGGRSVRAVVCPGHDEPRRVVCGTQLTRPGVCPHCRRRLTEDEYREATQRWRVVEEWEAA